jgi:hypothetical protein
MNLIRNSRSDLQLSPLSPGELEATMKSWNRRLGDVPTEYLEKCFDIALKTQGMKRSALTVFQVLTAWQTIIPRIQAQENRQKECFEYGCSADGWVTVNTDGSIWRGEDGNTSARPCPIHRPQGWQVDEFNQSNYLPNRREETDEFS